MQIEQLLEEKLVLVKTRKQSGDYIYVDWGPISGNSTTLPSQKMLAQD